MNLGVRVGLELAFDDHVLDGAPLAELVLDGPTDALAVAQAPERQLARRLDVLGRVIARLLSPDGMIVGVCWTPHMH